MTTGLAAYYSGESERQYGPPSHDVLVNGVLHIVAARSKGAAKTEAQRSYPGAHICVPGYKPPASRPVEYMLRG